MHQRRIHVQRQHGRAGSSHEVALLRGDHVAIFIEGGDQALVDARGHARVGRIGLVGLLEEIMRSGRSLGRQGLATVQLHRMAQVVRCIGHRPAARAHQERARQQEIVNEPAIDIGRELLDLRIIGRRRHVRHMPAHAQAALAGLGHRFNARARQCDGGAATQGFLVHIAQVRKIEQVVADQQIGRLVVHVAGLVVPVGGIAGKIVGQHGQVGARGIAHPHEDPLVALGHRVGLDARRLRRVLHAGHLDTGAVGIELQAVITAANAVAFAPPFRQGRLPVAAAVFENGQSPGGGAIHQERLAQHRARHKTVGRNLVFPGDHVPAIAQPHFVTPGLKIPDILAP